MVGIGGDDLVLAGIVVGSENPTPASDARNGKQEQIIGVEKQVGGAVLG